MTLISPMPDPPEFHIYATPEDLPENLRSHVVQEGRITVLKTALMTEIFPIGLPLPIEDFVSFRKQQGRQLLEQGKFASFVFFHARPFRMDILRDLVTAGAFRSSPEAYWDLARQVWCDAEQPEDDIRWRLLIEADLEGRAHMTSPRDRDALQALPDQITLYRGVQAQSEEEALDCCLSGWSWSLSQDTAAWFARRMCPHDKEAFTARCTIPKSDVIAYLRGRNEEEIIVDPDRIAMQEVQILS